MRKGLKVLSVSLLLTSLFVTGCSCSKEEDEVVNISRLENHENGLLNGLTDQASKYTLQDVYDSLIAGDNANKEVANKLVELVANEVLEINDNNKPWKARYEALVKEKMKELASNSSYLVKGEFSEKYFVDSLKAEGYNVTCSSDVTYGTPEALACDYSAYINKNIKVEVLSTLLKQKYIQDVTLEERANVLTNKKIRDVEYFTVTSSLDSSYEDLNVRNFMRSLRDRIADEEVVDFAQIEEELKTKMKDIVKVEYDKIGTSSDYSQSIAAKYTNNYTQSLQEGYDAKIKEVEQGTYSFEKVIGSDSVSNAVISDSITSTLLSITDPTSDDFKRKVVSVTDSENNTYYYLVNANAGTTVDASDVLLSETSDSSTYTYSVVRFKVINSETEDANAIYEAVKLMANESTLANSALSHYIKEKKDIISVYDDQVKAYLEALYPDVFAD